MVSTLVHNGLSTVPNKTTLPWLKRKTLRVTHPRAGYARTRVRVTHEIGKFNEEQQHV